MGSLQQVGDLQIAPLLRSDATRVARALRDRTLGRARLTAGTARGVRYVRIDRANEYTVVIHEPEWRKIAPFIRYASEALAGASSSLIASSPEEVPAFQPRLTREAPRQNPSPGLTSYLERLSYDDYRRTLALLSLTKPFASGDYQWFVAVLENLFPRDYPNV